MLLLQLAAVDGEMLSAVTHLPFSNLCATAADRPDLLPFESSKRRGNPARNTDTQNCQNLPEQTTILTEATQVLAMFRMDPALGVSVIAQSSRNQAGARAVKSDDKIVNPDARGKRSDTTRYRYSGTWPRNPCRARPAGASCPRHCRPFQACLRSSIATALAVCGDISPTRVTNLPPIERLESRGAKELEQSAARSR